MSGEFVATPEHSPMQLWEQAERDANGNEALRIAIYNVYMRQAGHVIDRDQDIDLTGGYKEADEC